MDAAGTAIETPIPDLNADDLPHSDAYAFQIPADAVCDNAVPAAEEALCFHRTAVRFVHSTSDS